MIWSNYLCFYLYCSFSRRKHTISMHTLTNLNKIETNGTVLKDIELNKKLNNKKIIGMLHEK